MMGSALKNRVRDAGNVIFYVLLAVGLLAALTFALVNGSRESTNTQNAYRMAEELYTQINFIKTGILECTLQYPGGITGGGITNIPYPVNPSSASNPFGAAANDNVSNVTCSGAPDATSGAIFGTTGTKGRILPLPPSGFSVWTYINDAAGVRIKITAPNSADALSALAKVIAKFNTCEADLNYAACGTNCLVAWFVRATCP